MVISLLGVVATVAFISISSYKTHHLYAAAERIAADIRYAKNLALTTAKWHGVLFAANHYSIYETDGATDTTIKSLMSPAANYVVDLSLEYHDVSIAALVNLGSSKVEFSPHGVPYHDKNGAALGLTGEVVLAGVGAGGGGCACGGASYLSVYISPQTGRIYIQ